MGLLQTILKLRAEQPNREAREKLLSQQVELDKIKTQLMKKIFDKGGLVDSAVATSDVPASSIEEMTQLMQAANTAPGGQGNKPEGILEQLAGRAGGPVGQPQSGQSGFLEGMSPVERLLVGDTLGYDFQGLANDQERVRHNAMLEENASGRLAQQTRANDIRASAFERANTEWVPLTVTLQDGSKQVVMMPKFGGGGAGTSQQGPPSLQLSPTAKSMPIKADELPLYVHPVTFEHPPLGLTGEEVRDQGFIRISAGMQDKVRQLSSARMALEEIRGLMEETIPKEEGPLGKFIGGPMRGLEAATQATDRGVKLAAMRDYIKSVRVSIAKALGEAGNLTEAEQQQVTDALGNITDRGEKAWSSFELIEKFFGKARAATLGIPYEEDITTDSKPPKDVLKKLKQGVVTKFANGQEWMLDSAGEPVRLK